VTLYSAAIPSSKDRIAISFLFLPHQATSFTRLHITLRLFPNRPSTVPVPGPSLLRTEIEPPGSACSGPVGMEAAEGGRNRKQTLLYGVCRVRSCTCDSLAPINLGLKRFVLGEGIRRRSVPYSCPGPPRRVLTISTPNRPSFPYLNRPSMGERS